MTELGRGTQTIRPVRVETSREGAGKGAVRPRAAGSVLRPPSVSRPRCPAGSDEQKEQRPSGQERGERAGAVCAKSFP